MIRAAKIILKIILRPKENPEWNSGLASAGGRLMQKSKQVQTDDDDQRDTCQPENEIACHMSSPQSVLSFEVGFEFDELVTCLAAEEAFASPRS